MFSTTNNNLLKNEEKSEQSFFQSHNKDNVLTLSELVKNKQTEMFAFYVNNLKEGKSPDNKGAEDLENTVRVNIPQQKAFQMYLHAVFSEEENSNKVVQLVVYENKVDENFIDFIKLTATKILLAINPKYKIIYKLSPPLEVNPLFSKELTIEDMVYLVRFLGLGQYPFAYDQKRFSINQVLIDLVRQAQQILADHNNKVSVAKVHYKYNNKVFKAEESLGQEYIKGLMQVLSHMHYNNVYLQNITASIINNGKMIPQKDRIKVLQRFVSGKRHSPAQILSVCTKIERAGIRNVLGLSESELDQMCNDFKKTIDKLKLNPSDINLKVNDQKIAEMMKNIPYPVYSCLYARIRARNELIRAKKAELSLQLQQKNVDKQDLQNKLRSTRYNINIQEIFKYMTYNQISPLYLNPFHVAVLCYVKESFFDEILSVSSNAHYYFVDQTKIYRPNIEYLTWVLNNCPEESLKKQAEKEIKFIQERINVLASMQQSNVPSIDNQINAVLQQQNQQSKMPVSSRRGGGTIRGGVRGSNRGGKYQSKRSRGDSHPSPNFQDLPPTDRKDDI